MYLTYDAELPTLNFDEKKNAVNADHIFILYYYDAIFQDEKV